MLDSFGYYLTISEDDVGVKQIPTVKRGTHVIFEIDTTSKLHLNDVFQNSNPDIMIQEENMSEGVQFMIKRAKNEAKKK